MSKVDHLTESIFMVGETVAKNDSLFPENMVTFAGATEVIEFGKTTADKRVVMYAVGDWVASNKIKLWLKKFWSPSVDVSVRIETVDWSWLATGTLVDANAYGTTLTSGLTTTVVDTEITLNGSITIPKGTNVAVIIYAWTYGSETVNGTNYFGIANKTQVTRSFWYGLYNASYTNYTNKMVYFSSDLFAKTLLSLTSASQVETLPTDFPRLTQTAWTRGQIVPVTFDWLHTFSTDLIENTVYYLGNTAWTISTVQWTNNRIIWKTTNKRGLLLWLYWYETAITSLNFTKNNPARATDYSTVYKNIDKRLVTITLTSVVWYGWWATAFIQYSADNVNRATITSINAPSEQTRSMTFTTIFIPWMYYRWWVSMWSNWTGYVSVVFNQIIQ